LKKFSKRICKNKTSGANVVKNVKVQHRTVKGSTQTNKKIKVRVQKKGAKETEENPGLAHQTVRCATGHCPVHQGSYRLNSPPSEIWKAALL
jgi:hypothetical protein